MIAQAMRYLLWYPATQLSMIARILLVCLIGCGSWLTGLAHHPPLSFLKGDLAAAQAQARSSARPLLVYIDAAHSPEARQMMRHTWSSDTLQTWLTDHYLLFRQEVAADTLSACRLPHYRLQTTPTLLVYHPDGRLMGSVEGYVAPSTLINILTRHYQRIYPPNEPEVVAFRQVPPPAVSVSLPAHHAVNLSVNGLEAYSLRRLQADPAQPTLGLRVGAYESYRRMRRELRRMEKIWPGEVWVYAETEASEAPVYTVVLGTFEDLPTANRYADAMHRYATCEAAILDLNYLLQQP